MNAAAPSTDPVACAHCGLPVPGGDPDRDTPQFCCKGCLAVWRLMGESGLDDFYALRDQLGEAPPGQAVERADEIYARYDDPAFAERFVRRVGDASEVELHVDGVHCTACVWVMEQLPRVLPGVAGARLDFGRQRLWLRWRGDTSLSTIARFLHRIGYASRPLGAEADDARRRADRAELIRLATMMAVAGNVMLVAFALYAGAFSGMEPRFVRFFETLALVLSIPAVTYGAWPFYRGAIAGLRMRVAHMDLPISLGIVASFGASAINTVRGVGEVYFDSVTALVALLLVGRFVLNRGQRAAMNKSELLSALTPDIVRRMRPDGVAERIGVDALEVGDTLRIEADETVPADGVILDGRGHVDQRLLTGESQPIAVAPGDQVFAGTRCVGGALDVRTAATTDASRLGRLVALIDRADGNRAPIARAVDRLSGLFVGCVLGLATIGGIAWSVIDPSRAFDVVVALLVVSCPCALGMATPVALAMARRRAAQAGIVLRSTAALERLARVERVFFDKTGTLTEGRMHVVEAWVPVDLRPAICALERRSAHPAGRAVAAWAAGGCSPEAIASADAALSDVRTIVGRGISARLGGQRLFIGAPDDPGPFGERVDAAVRAGRTAVIVRVDDRPMAALALGDRIRPGARAAIDRLRARGIEVGLLSGDHPKVARAVGDALGIDDARGGQSPEAKAAAVARGAMVGDGFNDAPALRAAEVGIAVHGGAEVALEVADVYLSRPDPEAVADAIDRAHAALRVVRRGLAISLLYNAIFAQLALFGHISPLAAAILMPASSITVIAHAVLSGRTTGRHRPV